MLYIAGGQTADAVPTVYDQVSRYNYTTNSWSNVAPLPVALSQAATGAWNGKIYVAGGFIGGTSVTNALRIYDIATNTWTTGAAMPTTPGVEAAAAAVVNGKFYVMGGDDFNNGLNTNFIYDIATNTWTTGATLPDNRTNTYGTAANGLIYVYGGVILPAFTTTDTLLRYDPVANSWTNLGSAGTAGARGNYGGISPLGTGQLLITDGADASGSSTTATHIFTISSGTFSAGPAMIGNRAGHAQGTLPDGRVLVADGFNTASTTVSTGRTAHQPLPESHAYSDADGNFKPDSYANCDSNSNAYTDSYADCDGNGNAYTNSYANCDSNGDIYAYGDRDGYIHAYGDRDGYIHAYSDRDGYIHAYSDRHRYIHAYGNSNGNGNGYSDHSAAAYTDATASADTAASPLALLRN